MIWLLVLVFSVEYGGWYDVLVDCCIDYYVLLCWLVFVMLW